MGGAFVSPATTAAPAPPLVPRACARPMGGSGDRGVGLLLAPRGRRGRAPAPPADTRRPGGQNGRAPRWHRDRGRCRSRRAPSPTPNGGAPAGTLRVEHGLGEGGPGRRRRVPAPTGHTRTPACRAAWDVRHAGERAGECEVLDTPVRNTLTGLPQPGGGPAHIRADAAQGSHTHGDVDVSAEYQTQWREQGSCNRRSSPAGSGESARLGRHVSSLSTGMGGPRGFGGTGPGGARRSRRSAPGRSASGVGTASFGALAPGVCLGGGERGHDWGGMSTTPPQVRTSRPRASPHERADAFSSAPRLMPSPASTCSRLMRPPATTSPLTMSTGSLRPSSL